MEKLSKEFNTLDLIIFVIVLVLSVFLGVGVLPAFIVYVISRKVDSKSFKIASYIAIGILIFTALGWRFQYELYNFVERLFFEELGGTDYMRKYHVIYVILHGIPFFGYLGMFITYILGNQRTPFIMISLFYIVISRFILFSVNLILSFTDVFDELMRRMGVNLFGVISPEPYLMALIVALLYWELFVPKGKIQEEKEVYETYEEAF